MWQSIKKHCLAQSQQLFCLASFCHPKKTHHGLSNDSNRNKRLIVLKMNKKLRLENSNIKKRVKKILVKRRVVSIITPFFGGESSPGHTHLGAEGGHCSLDVPHGLDEGGEGLEGGGPLCQLPDPRRELAVQVVRLLARHRHQLALDRDEDGARPGVCFDKRHVLIADMYGGGILFGGEKTGKYQLPPLSNSPIPRGEGGSSGQKERFPRR